MREQKSVFQNKLLKLADISSNTVAKLGLDKSLNPNIDTLQKNFKALDVKVNDLINKFYENYPRKDISTFGKIF